MCTNFCPQETAIPFPWHHKIESKTKGSGQCLRLGRRHYNFYPSSELLTILILPPKIECIPMKQCTAISDLFILGSLLGYFTHTNFLGCFKGKLTGTPCFFPLYPVPEQFFPSMKHTCSWRCLSTSRTTHTHTPSLEFLRIRIPERNKIHQDPWDIPSQPLIRTSFFGELIHQNMVSEGPKADSQGLEGANSQPSLDLWLLLPSFDSCHKDHPQPTRQGRDLESRKPS